jgi:uncharacterized membrane protein
MQPILEKAFRRWAEAGLLDDAAARRLRAFEEERARTRRPRWPVYLAVSLGGLLLGAGVLLFVAAHWDDISPAQRFGIVLAMVAGFHAVGAAVASRFAALASVLHAVGTACLGAGIFLAGQIFNLQEHWPGGLMLWAAGAWAGWVLLKDWPQAAFAAVLTPAWLAGEWIEAAERLDGFHRILSNGLLLLAFTYLSARTREQESAVRRALAVLGALAVIPCALYAWPLVAEEFPWRDTRPDLPADLRAGGWGCALIVPLGLALILRGRAAWMNAVAAAWVVVLGTMAEAPAPSDRAVPFIWHEFAPYVWCLLGSAGLIAWGLREGRAERVNLGVAGFALTVLGFYFSSVMDKLGRSASLIGLGVLFLAGGWILERERRRLNARLGGAPS